MEDLQRFIDILPQKYPFRMIDEIVEYEEGKSLTAIKNITGTEWIFDGPHCKTDIFPETLIIEAAAQTALTFFNASSNVSESRRFLLGKVDAQFSDQARVGEQLYLRTTEHKRMEKSGYIDIECLRDDKKISEIRVFYGLLE